MTREIRAGAVAVFAVITFTVAALPAQDSPTAFAQSRVWIVVLALIAALVFSLLQGKLRPFLHETFRHRLNVTLLCWWSVTLLSALLAPLPRKALLGSSSGQMGTLQLGLCLVLFYIFQRVTLKRHEWRILSIAMMGLVFFAALEAVGLRPLFWLPEATPYPSVTIGQRGHLAGLFALVAGVAAYRQAYPTLFLALIGICLCNNTSALLAFIALCILSLIFDCRSGWKPLTAALLLAIPIFFFTPSIIAAASLVPEKGIQMKQFGTSDAPSLGIRLKFWKASWFMFLDRPLLGWGDEQYQERWVMYLPVEEQMPMILEVLGLPKDAALDGSFPNYFYMDKDGLSLKSVNNIHPHNNYIEELQNHGLLGFLLILYSIVLLFSENRKIIIAVAGYGVYLIAWFFVFSVLPIFAMILGILVADHRSKFISIEDENNNYSFTDSKNIILK